MKRKNGPMLTVAESALYLGKSTKTVRRYIKQGLLSSERVSGKFGPELRIPRKGLDILLKNMSTPSKGDDDPLEILRLFRQASPDIRELVMKILRSGPSDDIESARGGFLRPFFWKKGGEKP